MNILVGQQRKKKEKPYHLACVPIGHGPKVDCCGEEGQGRKEARGSYVIGVISSERYQNKKHSSVSFTAILLTCFCASAAPPLFPRPEWTISRSRDNVCVYDVFKWISDGVEKALTQARNLTHHAWVVSLLTVTRKVQYLVCTILYCTAQHYKKQYEKMTHKYSIR